ncbi:MAG: hypothetical protein VKJ04_10380 [Vampirovibrionales bacterium]|nr:hypothetical protein [Vampirovibrionales bacterium]
MNTTATKSLLAGLLLCGVMAASTPQALADNSDPPRRGNISGRSVAAGLLSFFIWPGIGQAVNSNKGEKVLTHAVIGLLPPFRFWSGYDGLVDRQGGYWHGRI